MRKCEAARFIAHFQQKTAVNTRDKPRRQGILFGVTAANQA